jgi:hypothetical protein
MSELARQLLSTKLNQVAGESAGHNNESAIYEIIDNEIDINAKQILLLVCLTNLCWAILENGPGIENINNLWGAGDGVKIKNGDKIGNKLSGEFAAAAFLEANKTMYFSRCNENTDKRKHQQLNAKFYNMIKVIKTPGIDMVEADNIMLSGPNKLVRIPEPDSDKFDSDNVEYVKGLFKNNEHILSYFNSNKSGMLKVFVYEEGNTDKFTSFTKELPKILDKMEFISYNTIKGFKGDRLFEYIDVDAQDNRVINEESCKENFILGRSAMALENEDAEVEYVENCLFGDISLNKVLYLSNSIYESENKKYNKCEIINFEEKFFIGESIKKHLDDAALDSVTKTICKESNFKSEIPILLSFVDENETKIHLEKMTGTEINNLTQESLKQVYIYFSGRFLGKCELSTILTGIQERSLPNFRIVICLNDYSSKLINIRAQKSSVSLKTADKIIIKTLTDIIKPVLNCFSSSSKLINFTQGIDDWRKHKRSVLTSLGIKLPLPTQLPVSVPPTPNPIPQTVQTTATTVQRVAEIVPSIPPPTQRAATIVLSSLTKTQTIQQLRRLRVKANNDSNFKTKADRTKVYSILNKIEKEIVISEVLLVDKIDYLIELLEGSELTNSEKVKEAAPLQEL